MDMTTRTAVARPDTTASSALVALAQQWTATGYTAQQLASLSDLLGYPTEVLAEATRSGEWDEVVWRFGDATHAGAVFAGWMRAREGAPEAPGVLVSAADEDAREVSEVVSNNLDAIGQHVFGYPCKLHGRVVEFVDVEVASGPLVEAEETPIALFSPFYLGGWHDQRRQLQARRTIMFSNAVAGRFRLIAGRLADRGVTVNGSSPQILSAPEETLRGAIATWLTLHEVMHGSGPAPFFAPWTGKATSTVYGVVEESRVDMTAMVGVAALEDVLETTLTRELILLERLCRSARRGWSRLVAGESPNLDDEHGMVWADALVRTDAVSITGAGIDIDLAGAQEAATRVLTEIYAAEQKAAESDDCAGALDRAAHLFRRRHLPPEDAPNPLAEPLMRLGLNLPLSVGLAGAISALR